MARLTLQSAEGTQVAELRPVNSLGRHPDNSIQLLDKIVSKVHCIIELRGDQYVLRDSGSLNGTFINGTRVHGEQLLRHNDEIVMGSTRARFEMTPAGQPGLPPPASHPQVPAAASPYPPPHPHYPPQYPQAYSGYPQQSQPAQSGGASPPYPPHAPNQPPWPPPQAPGAQVSRSPQAMSIGGPVEPTAGWPHPPQGWPGGFPPPVPPSVIPSTVASPPQGPQPSQGQQAVPSLPPRHSPHPSAPPGVVPGAGPSAAVPLGAAPGGLGQTRYMSSTPSVQLQDQARQIGQQITATERGFLPVEHILGDPAQLRSDYEKLRLSHELSREIAAERDTEQLLRKILLSMLKFTKADRGVIFLANERGEFEPRSWEWRDGRNEPLRVSSTILNHVVEKQAAVLTSDAANFDKNRKNDSVILNRIGSAIVAPLLHHNEVLGVAWLDSETLGQFKPKDLEIVVAICAQAAMFIEIAALGRKVQNEVLTRERFSRLLSPNIAELVVRGQLEVKQGGTLVEATVFNSDIRGFTGMSEGKDPQVLVEMLNQYFERMVDTVFKFEGTLDKFMGDGIMAIWGAPVSHRDDPIRAVQSALAMGEVLGRFNRERMAVGHDPLAIGIGIHTGPVVAGYIGSSKALSFTVIGDVANTSARICGVALAGQVVVSETTRDRLGTRFELEELPPARLKGKEHPVRIFNVLRERPSAQVPAHIGSGAAGAPA